jgi:hypothetical protein
VFKIQDLMTENFSAYPEETQEFMKKYTCELRETIITELVEDIGNRMLKDLEKSNEAFMNVLSEILENGCRGFKEMSTQKLINLYLERKDEMAFMRLIEKVNDNIED